MFLPLHARARARSPALLFLHHSRVHALPVCACRLPRKAVLNSFAGPHTRQGTTECAFTACMYVCNPKQACTCTVLTCQGRSFTLVEFFTPVRRLPSAWEPTSVSKCHWYGEGKSLADEQKLFWLTCAGLVQCQRVGWERV